MSFKIETERLILREWRDEDRGPFASINSSAEVMALIGGPLDRAGSDKLLDVQIANQRAHGFCYWALEGRVSRELIGFCGLRRGRHDGTPIDGEMDAAWRLARGFWGQGLALEAASAALDWAWKHTDALRVCAWTIPANIRSWGLMIRLGMVRRPELDFGHPAFPPNHPLHDHVVYAIDRPQ